MPVAETNTPTEKITAVVHDGDFTTDWDHILNEDGSVSKVRLTQTTQWGLPEPRMIYPSAQVGESWAFGHHAVPAGHSIAEPSETCKKGYRAPGKEVEYLWEVEPSSRDPSTIAPEDKSVTHRINHWYAGTECETRTIDRVRSRVYWLYCITDQ
jgi:hypothetical protein